MDRAVQGIPSDSGVVRYPTEGFPPDPIYGVFPRPAATLPFPPSQVKESGMETIPDTITLDACQMQF